MFANGLPYLAIPGPSVMPDRVLRAMHRPAPNIYAGELVDVTASLIPDLRYVARTKHHVAMYIGNGHAAWEAAMANIANPGDLFLVPATGRFAHGWADMAHGVGAETQILDKKACKIKAKLAYMSVIGVGCQSFRSAQKDACVCVKDDDVANRKDEL